MKRILTTTVIGTALALAFSSPLMARQVESTSEARAEAVRDLAAIAADPAFDTSLRTHIGKGKASLADVLRDYDASGGGGERARIVDDLRDLDRQAIALRGLSGAVDALVDLRLSGVDPGKPMPSTRDLWIATVTRDAVTGEKTVLAFDTTGTERHFALDQVPDLPMLVVESDNSAAVRAGLAVVNEALRSKKRQATPAVDGRLRSGGAAPKTRIAGFASAEQLTLIKSIYLEKDHEPNIQGDAEIFAIVSGVGPDGTAQVITREMPWLDHDKRWYRPNMDLINWTDFGTNYVNVQIFEDDGDTNFQDLAVALTGAVGDVATLVSPAAPPALIIAGVSKIGATILSAMDKKWFKNDADYVDSFYVIERGGNYGSDAKPLIGARGEAKMVLAPYEVKGR